MQTNVQTVVCVQKNVQMCIRDREIAEDIKKRDERDMSRETAPLKQAEDAILIDSSDTVSYTHLSE